MPSSLQEIIQQYSTEPPVYSSGSEVDKFNKISDTLSGNRVTGEKLKNEMRTICNKVITLLQSPLPGSTTPNDVQTNQSSNRSAPSYTRE